MNPGLMYRTGTVEGASPTALVARLYEQLVKDLREALQALERNDIASRTDKINHALLVIGYLESQLNFLEGGIVAENLRGFYHFLRGNLIQAQLRQSKTILVQMITDLLAVREAWTEVERAAPVTPAVSTELVSSGVPGSADGLDRLDWKG